MSFLQIIVPVHQGMHWVLAVVDIKQRVLTYYDSFNGADPQCLEYLVSFALQTLQRAWRWCCMRCRESIVKFFLSTTQHPAVRRVLGGLFV